MTLEIIQHPDSTFQELMDFKIDVRDENYHPSSFVISKEVSEGLLLFHTLTCEMVLACKGREDGISSYTIMTTTDCNARCFYCYEKGRSRIPMSEKTAMKVASLIERNYSRLPKDKKEVSLRWFGGEPLYNGKVIDLICIRLKMCEESANCTPEKIENQVNQIKFAMVRTYEKYRIGK